MADDDSKSANAAADEVPPSDKGAELSRITASASQNYASKKYDAAADLYSQALALQENLNGEMNPANADLLYAYGKCLFQLGVNKSDVLGAKVAGDAKKQTEQSPKKRKRPNPKAEPGPSNQIAESIVEKAVEAKDSVKSDASETKDKPFFQISGDAEDWEDDSDDDAEGDQGQGGDEEEEDDDLATAYEILDLARVLFQKRIEAATDDAREAKEMLADVHDLQAEISLENERFHDAINDSRASLALKKALYPPEKGIVAEAHFKLSLALEFASVTVQKDDQTTGGADQQQVDEGLRKEAGDEMDLAISCTKCRMNRLDDALRDGKGHASDKDLKEINEIIADMEQRLEDLRNPAISVNSALGPAGAAADGNPLGGILGSILGETPSAQKARIEEAAKGANDLSGLVKRKPRKEEPETTGDKGKRKADGDEADERSKRAKTEEAGDN